MQAAFIRSPIAFVLHALGLAGLMLAYQQMQLPLYVSVPSIYCWRYGPGWGPGSGVTSRNRLPGRPRRATLSSSAVGCRDTPATMRCLPPRWPMP